MQSLKTVNKKLQVWLPLIFSLVLIAGMYIGYKMGNQGSGRGFLQVAKNTSLQEALDLIRQRYVDKVNLDSIQRGAIREMMDELEYRRENDKNVLMLKTKFRET